MRQFLIPLLAFIAVAGPAAAETRYLAYDAADRVTQALTRGITLEADRGLFGAISVMPRVRAWVTRSAAS